MGPGLAHSGVTENFPVSVDDEPDWYEPTPHEGEREIPIRQAGTARGSTVFNGRVVVHESELEHRLSTMIQARRDVVELRSQFPLVHYIDAEGKRRRHIFDYWIRFRDGRRTAVAAKYEKHRAEIEPVLRRIRQTGSPEFDVVSLMTEKKVTVEAYQNAGDILISREHHDEQQVQLLREDLAKRGSNVCFVELYDIKVPLKKRWTAVWRLIDAGMLIPKQPGRINDVTWFSVNL